MPVPTSEPSAVVSANIYALILTSPRLKQQLLPEGLSVSPYKVLDYHATLVLGDKKGSTAVFERTQHIQFQQQGVGAILDHFWGAGVQLTEYANTAGRIADSFRDEGRRHLVVELPRPMARGEALEFTSERSMLETFSTKEGWFELTVDHPILQLSHGILFPKDRPCQQAHLVVGEWERRLPIIHLAGDKTLVRYDQVQPEANTPYRI